MEFDVNVYNLLLEIESDSQALKEKMKAIYIESIASKEETAERLLDLMDRNQEIIELDTSLSSAYSNLTKWRYSRKGTNSYLIQVAVSLNIVNAIKRG